ncbi:hypothetical protein BURCENBC7_AP4234 [Burkholderia cenocepacia BC7]|nr:hypothetical protein BURCENBC7_AP4234 [Burkholderia cenocepacia BC7]
MQGSKQSSGLDQRSAFGDLHTDLELDTEALGELDHFDGPEYPPAFRHAYIHRITTVATYGAPQII